MIGSDGLDKKSCFDTNRFLYLCGWHEKAPCLVRALHEGPEKFHAIVAQMPRLRGELSSKDLYVILAVAAAAYKDHLAKLCPKLEKTKGEPFHNFLPS